MATITKTKSKKWKSVIRKEGWPTKSKTFRLRRDAEDWSRKIEDEMVRGVYVDRAGFESLLFNEAMERYLREISSNKSMGSQKAELTHSKPLKAKFGKYAMSAISTQMISVYLSERQATVSKNTGRHISNSTCRAELMLLSHLFEVCIDVWHLGLIINPVTRVVKPKPHKGRNRRLTKSELKRLLQSVDSNSNPMLSYIVRIAMTTAMRSDEINSLTTQQVDLRRRIVTLTNTKNDEARIVPLTRRAASILKKAIENPARNPDSDLIFPGYKGRKTGKVNQYQFKRVWRLAVKRAKIDDFRFHDLRHEAVSRLVEMGLSDQEVSAISGHKTMQMLRRYTHLRAEDLVARLDSLKKR